MWTSCFEASLGVASLRHWAAEEVSVRACITSPASADVKAATVMAAGLSV